MGDGAMRLPPADVTATSGEQSAYPGRHKGSAQAAPQHGHSVARETRAIGNRLHASLPPRHFSLKTASYCIGYFVVTIPRQSSGSAATFKF